MHIQLMACYFFCLTVQYCYSSLFVLSIHMKLNDLFYKDNIRYVLSLLLYV